MKKGHKEKKEPADSASGRPRSPSSVGIDGASTWSPSHFKKTMNKTKVHQLFQAPTAQLEKLVAENETSAVNLGSIVGCKDYADVIYHVGTHVMYAHRAVVESRCPALFSKGVKERSKKGSIVVLKMDEKLVDIRGLNLVMEYMYTGTVPFKDVLPAEVISLIAHSELFEIDRLRWLCERYMFAIMNNDLFFTLFLASDISGVTRAKNICLHYGSQHFAELIVQKEQVEVLGIELFRQLVVHTILTTTIYDDPEQINFTNTIKDEFKIVYAQIQKADKTQQITDASFIFKHENVAVSCHRAFLLAHSEKIKTLFATADDPGVSHSYSIPKRVAMPSGAFRSMLSWIYYRETSFSTAHAAQMLPFALDYDIRDLIMECEKKLRAGPDTQCVIPVLDFCYSEWGRGTYKAEISVPFIAYLVSHFGDVDISTLNTSSSALIADIAIAVRHAVSHGQWVANSASQSDHTAPSEPIEVSENTEDRKDKRFRRKKRNTVELASGFLEDSDATTPHTARGDESQEATLDTPKKHHKKDHHHEESGKQVEEPETPKEAVPVEEKPAEETPVQDKSAEPKQSVENPTEEVKPAVEEAPKPVEAEEAKPKDEAKQPEETKSEEKPKEESTNHKDEVPTNAKASKEESEMNVSKKESSQQLKSSTNASDSDSKPAKSPSNQDMNRSKSTERVTPADVKLKPVEKKPETAKPSKDAGETKKEGVKGILQSFEAKSREEEEKEKETQSKSSKRKSVNMGEEKSAVKSFPRTSSQKKQ